MSRPDVILGEQSRIGMLRGFESMARLLAITLGPIGGNIANARDIGGGPELLTDAATVARRIIQIPGGAEDAGAMMMRHLVWRVRDQVGDGSATTAVLARAIAKETQRMIAAGANAMLIRRGIEKAVAAAAQALEGLSIPLEGEENIAAVATASTGNAEIGKLLGEIYDVLGPNAQIVIEPYIGLTHDRAYHDGARFKGEYLSPYFITDVARRVVVIDNPHILVADMAFETVEGIQNVLEQVIKAGGTGLFIVCKLVADKGIGVMVANNERGAVRSCASNLKPVGDLRRGTFENIATLVGGKVLTDTSGMSPEDISITDMGRAARIIATKDHFTIIGGQGDKAAIRERVQKLRQRLRAANDSETRDVFRELLTHFSAGVGELRVGALTEQERKDLTEVAEQSMKAVTAGMEGGIVPGGGAAYLACISAVEAVEAQGDEAIGVRIIARALEEPMRCIAANAGFHAPVVVAEARRAGVGYGFDVREKKIVRMIEQGIMDPTVIAKHALRTAASGAMMLLTTDALVLHRKPKESFEP